MPLLTTATLSFAAPKVNVSVAPASANVGANMRAAKFVEAGQTLAACPPPVAAVVRVRVALAWLAVKRGGGQAIHVTLSEAAGVELQQSPDLVALDDALTALEKLNPRHSRIVELRFFGGLSLEEAAEFLHLSVSTVRRDWRMAQAWLHQQLSATA